MLSVREDTKDKNLLWLNPHPAGSDFLRPYMMSFEKETEDMVSIMDTITTTINTIISFKIVIQISITIPPSGYQTAQ